MTKVRISPDHVYSQDAECNTNTCTVCVFDEEYLNECMDLNTADLIVLRDALTAFIDKNLIQTPGIKPVKQMKKHGKTFLVTDNGKLFVEAKGGKDE